MKKCIECDAKLQIKGEIIALLFSKKIGCVECRTEMIIGFILDQFIDLVAYLALIFTVLLSFDHLRGLGVVVGIAVFFLIKVIAYKYFYNLKKVDSR